MDKNTKLSYRIAKVGRVIQPIGEQTMRWSLIALAVLVALLEIDQIWSGKVYAVWQWIWTTLLSYKTVTFCLGLLTYHMLLRHTRHCRDSGIRDSVLKHATLSMDLDALEASANRMGVELRLKDDPKISSLNLEHTEILSQDLMTPKSEDKKK
jgi:hypothetical protein